MRLYKIACDGRPDMNFGIVNENPAELRKLTAMLISEFPGLVVYEFTSPADIIEHLKSHRLNAVFLDSQINGSGALGLLKMIRDINARLPVMICAEDDSLLDDAMWIGASAYLIKPLDPKEIKEALEV